MLRDELEDELWRAKAQSQDAYEGMKQLRRRMSDQQEEIRVLLHRLGTLLADYQGTCNSFHYAQHKAIEACRKERITREMIKLSEDL